MASDKELVIYKNILENMSDGVITISLEGELVVFNRSARQILGIEAEPAEEALTFDDVFSPYETPENEAFFDNIIKATYTFNTVNNELVDFFNPSREKTIRLSMATSFLQSGEKGEQEIIGVIAVFRDITELHELRDALSAMKEIEKLNVQLEKKNSFIRKAFGKYMSDEIVDRLLESPDGLTMGGEIKKVTVVMTDIRGFTAISEKMNAEIVLDMLNRYFEVMTEVIFKHGGTINKFIGDAIMILFGAPNQREDDAIRAVACALEMQLAMKQVNEKNLGLGLPSLEMGIGINTDKVIAGNMGSTKRTEYGVIGSGVNLASRIESLTVGGQILVSKSTLEEVESIANIGASFEAPFKGFEELVQVYEIIGLGGQYNLSAPPVDSAFLALPEPVVVYYSLLEGKVTTGDILKGDVVMVSNRAMVARLKAPVKDLCNVKFEIELPGKTKNLHRSFYGKVLGPHESGENMYLVHFTAIAEDIKKNLLEMAGQ